MLKNIRSEYLVLFFSIFLVAGYNQSLWQGLIESRGGLSVSNSLFFASCALFLTALFNLIFSIFAVKKLLKPLLILIIISSAATSYFMDTFGVFINSDMLQNALQTDTGEAFELFNAPFIIHMLLWGALPAWLIARLDIQYSSFFRQLIINVVSIVLSVIAIGGVAGAFYQDYASTFRNHREFRYLINPTNYIYAINKIIKNEFKQADKPIVPIASAVSLGEIATEKKRRTVTVLVLGETARAQNFHINGYKRQTTPLMEKNDIINFSDVSSCGTATAVSVPCMFSKFTRNDYSNAKGRQYEGVLDVIAASGINVLWRDNNSGCKGVCDRVEFENVSHLTLPEFCNDKECFDEVLLNQLSDRIAQAKGDMLIILHQKGSHGPAYYLRVPEKFEQFKPICQTSELQNCSQQDIVNAYDNTILYTDYFLNKVVEFLKTQSNQLNTAMLYVSDHGESLGEKNMYLHGAPYFMAPEGQTHVPMMLWLSDNYSQDYQLDRACLQHKSDDELSHDNLFHSLLGMYNVTAEPYQASLDIFNGCRAAQH